MKKYAILIAIMCYICATWAQKERGIRVGMDQYINTWATSYGEERITDVKNRMFEVNIGHYWSRKHWAIEPYLGYVRFQRKKYSGVNTGSLDHADWFSIGLNTDVQIYASQKMRLYWLLKVELYPPFSGMSATGFTFLVPLKQRWSVFVRPTAGFLIEPVTTFQEIFVNTPNKWDKILSISNIPVGLALGINYRYKPKP